MGWTYAHYWSHRRQMVDEIRADLVSSGWTIHMESSTNHGRQQFFLISRLDHGEEGQPGYRKGCPSLIFHVLCEYDSRTDQQCWGYKDVPEEMGPYEPCPRNVALAADKLGPAPNDYARNWRDAALSRPKAPRPDDWPVGSRFRWAGRDYLVTGKVGARSIAACRVAGDVRASGDFKFTMPRMARAVRVEV